jgi:hypothetical protein
MSNCGQGWPDSCINGFFVFNKGKPSRYRVLSSRIFILSKVRPQLQFSGQKYVHGQLQDSEKLYQINLFALSQWRLAIPSKLKKQTSLCIV